MKTLLLIGATLLLSPTFSQTTLLQDDFESGSANWTLSATGQNTWVVNNIYAGLPPLIVNTPSQPGAVQTNYLHIANATVCGLGYCNANYDTGSMGNATATSGPIVTTGLTDVTISYIYLCAGVVNQDFGTIEYSTNGGTVWNILSTYVNVGATWGNESIANPAFDNQADLRFRFKWQNSSSSGVDPAFSIDQVLIVGTPSATNSISTTNDASPASWCFNTMASGTVNFTSSGTFTAGNVYTAQLSDAAGSFAAPTSIGTLSSTASGALSISTSIPAGVPAGTGYRVRVVSSSPATTGTDNTSNLVINALPTVTMGALADVCSYNSAFSLTQGAPASGTYSGTGVSGGMFTPSSAGLGAQTITYTYVDGNGCSNSANTAINVNACASIDELNAADVVIVPNPVETSFQISGIDSESKVELVDFSGKTINSFDKGESSFDVSNLSEGVYIVRITKGSEVILTKLVKK